MPLVPVLAAMELRGVTVDHAELAQLSATSGSARPHSPSRRTARSAREVNLGSPKQLQEVLFDQLGMPKTRATKTGYTTDASALADLQESNPHPFLGYLLEHRDATKLRQIVESLDKAIGADGRIHTTYWQIGAATGRMSSNDPNLQNIPIRTAEGRRIRKAFRHGPEYAELAIRNCRAAAEEVYVLLMFAAEIGRMLDVRIPLVPMSHQYVVTDAFLDRRDRPLPTLRDPDLLVYFRQEVDGLVMGGYQRDPAP